MTKTIKTYYSETLKKQVAIPVNAWSPASFRKEPCMGCGKMITPQGNGAKSCLCRACREDMGYKS